MSTIVVGYFDSEDSATQAMDLLLTDPGFRDAESEVISNPDSGTGSSGVVGVTPIFPDTSGGSSGSTVVGAVPVTGGGGRRLFNEIDEAEAEFFNSALKSGGGVLALVKVDDDQAMRVRQLFDQNGARTYHE